MNESYEVEVSVNTARRWLHHLGFHQCDYQKGVYFDGHERDDVVTYRQEFLDRLASLDKTTITPTRPMPVVAEGERRYLRIAHESTFYANADQTLFWNDGHSQVLRQKSLGSSIMVSDFIVEDHGYLKDDKEAACVYLETQKEGYFNNEMFIAQVKSAIKIFEKNFPGTNGCLIMHHATRNSQTMLLMLAI